jgi:NAD(P)-dependent dehydrogenase (short-subunit alcohol dehydrogenase family)
MRLRDKTALVTGSTTGIGAAIAAALAAEGAYVVVSGRDAGRGATVVKEIGDRARFVGADLAAGPAAVRALADAAGPVDILVNNAAMIVPPGPTAEVTGELIDAAFAVNVRAAFLLTGLLAPAMAARGGGAVVNVGSINGLVGMAGSALYSATKATIHSLTRSWAAEYGPAGVRVNTVAPGPTRTEWIDATPGIDAYLSPLVAKMPSRRLGTPEEVAAAVVFLASADAANIHGALLSVDGGFAAV